MVCVRLWGRAGKWNRHPRINAQKVENLQLALDFIKASGAKLEDVSPTDIADGSIRGILNLLWALIQHFIVAGEDLLEWVRDRIPAYDIKGWKRDWNDGRAVCALVDALLPATCPGHQGMDAHQKLDNCARGIRLAQERLAVAPLLTAGEMANPVGCWIFVACGDVVFDQGSSGFEGVSSSQPFHRVFVSSTDLHCLAIVQLISTFCLF